MTMKNTQDNKDKTQQEQDVSRRLPRRMPERGKTGSHAEAHLADQVDMDNVVTTSTKRKHQEQKR